MRKLSGVNFNYICKLHLVFRTKNLTKIWFIRKYKQQESWSSKNHLYQFPIYWLCSTPSIIPNTIANVQILVIWFPVYIISNKILKYENTKILKYGPVARRNRGWQIFAKFYFSWLKKVVLKSKIVQNYKTSSNFSKCIDIYNIIIDLGTRDGILTVMNSERFSHF